MVSFTLSFSAIDFKNSLELDPILVDSFMLLGILGYFLLLLF